MLPPGDWDKKNLLSMSDIMELKRKKRMRLAAMEKMKKDKEKAGKALKKPEVEESKGTNLIKLFTIVIYKWAQLARVFVSDRLFPVKYNVCVYDQEPV